MKRNKLRQHRFERYVRAFDYGNKDVSVVDASTPGQKGGWRMSSLQVSPVQHIAFLSRTALAIKGAGAIWKGAKIGHTLYPLQHDEKQQ
ncbi:hypothetical protein N4G41_00385 [Kosakonia sacchari]|uniref:hypothetical protein n=1 Tax=Kosakonia sacchari TaxID=1158459 RepID=UPI002ACE5CC4|nr:hypothetical protein [Kosakonia sacchari]MDZ7320093.1 hypothetical protein [Kosakonia sacchari]